MLYLFTGTDSEKAREKMNAALANAARGANIVRITDAHSIADLEAALGGAGMFGEKKIAVLDNVFASAELGERVLALLPGMAKNEESVFMLETAPLAALRKTLEKYAAKTERHDAEKKEKKGDFFAMPNALQRADKKKLWILLQQEFAAGAAPEAVHGMLFWAAKQMVLKGGDVRSKKLVAELAELPHEARRSGFELEYALEHFVLSIGPAPHQNQPAR